MSDDDGRMPWVAVVWIFATLAGATYFGFAKGDGVALALVAIAFAIVRGQE